MVEGQDTCVGRKSQNGNVKEKDLTRRVSRSEPTEEE